MNQLIMTRLTNIRLLGYRILNLLIKNLLIYRLVWLDRLVQLSYTLVEFERIDQYQRVT